MSPQTATQPSTTGERRKPTKRSTESSTRTPCSFSFADSNRDHGASEAPYEDPPATTISIAYFVPSSPTSPFNPEFEPIPEGKEARSARSMGDAQLFRSRDAASQGLLYREARSTRDSPGFPSIAGVAGSKCRSGTPSRPARGWMKGIISLFRGLLGCKS